MLNYEGLSFISSFKLTSFSQFDAKELGWGDDLESNGVDCSTPICWPCSYNGGTCATLDELGDNFQPPQHGNFALQKT